MQTTIKALIEIIIYNTYRHSKSYIFLTFHTIDRATDKILITTYHLFIKFILLFLLTSILYVIFYQRRFPIINYIYDLNIS